MKRILPIILLLLLLAGCGGQGGVATGGDLPVATEAASAGDLSATDALRTLLLSDGGAWRSDQQDSPDAGFTVRELCFQADGSFTYREGDFASEFCWFASGTWTLSGSELCFVYLQTDELGTPESGAAEQTARYTAASEDGGLRLTLTGETGFCTDAQGLNIHYYHPIS